LLAFLFQSASPFRHGLLERLPGPTEADKNTFHEPPGEGTGPTGCRPGPLTRRAERFMVPMHAEKTKGGFP